jgi:hypothetical protein
LVLRAKLALASAEGKAVKAVRDEIKNEVVCGLVAQVREAGWGRARGRRVVGVLPVVLMLRAKLALAATEGKAVKAVRNEIKAEIVGGLVAQVYRMGGYGVGGMQRGAGGGTGRRKRLWSGCERTLRLGLSAGWWHGCASEHRDVGGGRVVMVPPVVLVPSLLTWSS